MVVSSLCVYAETVFSRHPHDCVANEFKITCAHVRRESAPFPTTRRGMTDINRDRSTRSVCVPRDHTGAVGKQTKRRSPKLMVFFFCFRQRSHVANVVCQYRLYFQTSKTACCKTTGNFISRFFHVGRRTRCRCT